MKLLADADPEVVSPLGRLGLGYTCKGHEDAHVKALVARARRRSRRQGPRRARRALAAGRVRASNRPRARAVGRCATPLAEDALVSWLSARSVYSTPAALRPWRPRGPAQVSAPGDECGAGCGGAPPGIDVVPFIRSHA